MEKIEERKIVPIAAMISAGKSLLLNMILNIKFLESKTDIGTKFVNILRYNPKIDKPRFYHLKIKDEKGKYVFYKDPDFETIIGEERIIEENKKINYVQNKLKTVNYDNIFYMTEINSIGFLRDEQYMLTHDLCDIPGLSEYQEQMTIKKENENNETKNNDLKETIQKGKEFGLIESNDTKNNVLKPKNKNKNEDEDEDDIFYDLNVENESTYITEIYKRIKNFIDGAIIVLSVENYYFKINIEIIAKLHKVIEKKIKNFLIILNKMDLSANPSEDVESCSGFLFNSFPKCQTFNLNMNTFIPISALQVQNELLMKDSFRHLLLYHFYNYKKIKRQEKLLAQIVNNEVNNATFIEYLRNKLRELSVLTKQEIEMKVEELNSKNNISVINDEIKSIIKELNTNSSEDIELTIGIKESDVDEEEDDEGEDFLSSLSSQRSSSNKDNSINNIDPIYIIKMFYILQKEHHYRPQYSNETDKLLNYFSIKNDNENENNYIEADKIASNVEANKEIIKQLELFYNEFKNSNSDLDEINISNLSGKIQKLIEYLNIYDVIFIPFLGASNAGKSTIINGIIGRDLLPTALKECTKRGIIIRYSDTENVIKKADFEEEDFSNKRYYYLHARDYIIGKGDEQIKQTLKGLNYKFNEKEEDSFYYIKTKIKLFDDLGLEKSLKEMIYLIDFPGYGTGNFFKSDISKNVISICNTFIFVTRNSVIRNKDSKTMLDSFLQAKENKQQFSSQLIKSSLFIFNNDINQTSTPENLENCKNDIQGMIKGVEKEDIKLCFFNAKYYTNYCSTYNYFYNLDDMLKNEYNDYSYKNSSYFTDKTAIINSNFPQYLLNKLIEKAKSFQCKMKKNQKINEDAEKNINNYFEKIGEANNVNKINIIKILSFCKDNINKINYFNESNIEGFTNILKTQIQFVNDNKQKELRESIYNVLSILDMFFGKNFEQNKKNIEEINNFKNKMNELKEKTQKLIKNNIDENVNMLNNFKANTLLKLYDKRRDLQNILREQTYKEIVNEINSLLKDSIDKLIASFKIFLDSFDSKCSSLFKQIIDTINNFHENKVESLTKYNFKAHLSNHFGDGKKELSDEIMEEIRSRCECLSGIFYKKGFKEWFVSLISSETYLQHVIDMIVETYSEKIKDFLEMIQEESINYLNQIMEKIDNNIKSSAMEFNDSQKEKWKRLCESYEKTKAEIIKIENKNNNNIKEEKKRENIVENKDQKINENIEKNEGKKTIK